MYIKYKAGKKMEHSKKNNKKDKEFANAHDRYVKLEVLHCREFTFEAFVEMVLKFFLV